MPLSEIRFGVSDYYGSDAKCIVPFIDDVSLVDLVTVYETASGFDVKGGYDGLVPANHNFGPLDDHFNGLAPNGRNGVGLLGCECGEWGCWPLLATIEKTSDVVRWSNFQQPHRPNRDYCSFGPFEFAAERYSAAVVQLTTALGAN